LAILLLLQDDDTGTQAVRAAFAHASNPTFELSCVRDPGAALARLADTAASPVSAMLVDPQLAGSNGIELIERLIAAAPQVPVVVLSTRANEPLARLAMQHGAQDYLLKERLDDYVLPKAMLAVFERAAIANALREERERAQVTLDSIGDAVISTDALGQPLELVLGIIDEATRTGPSPTR
jgi:DNA-binding NarL/FixJ family response regulator